MDMNNYSKKRMTYTGPQGPAVWEVWLFSTGLPLEVVKTFLDMMIKSEGVVFSNEEWKRETRKQQQDLKSQRLL